jgi:[ribosomal protein S18]-alanine N-acetyltransferase
MSSLVLRYMRLSDIDDIVAIDRMAFDLPWSDRSYRYEITESTYSHMVTLEYGDNRRPNGWWRRLWGRNHQNSPRPIVAGYGGLWRIMEEAHISTIATHPNWRGRGWGEVLLAGMIRRSMMLGARYVVLEVRVSNTIAQNLYQKYEFQAVALKPQYYRNNNEDAYDMRLNLEDTAMRARFDQRFAELQARHGFADLYTDTAPPRG